MKILINALSARRGGIITYTRNLMKSFSERNIDAIFALPDLGKHFTDANCLYFPVTTMRPLTRALWEQTVWRWTVSRIKPDILYSSANFGLLQSSAPQVLLIREGGLFDPHYMSIIAPSLGAKAALSRIMRRHLILRSARNSDCILTPTNAMRDLLGIWDPKLVQRVMKNSYGTRLDQFTEPAVPNVWRKDRKLRLLLVSAYYPHKQPGLIAEAVRLLNERGCETQLTVTMSLDDISSMPGSAKDIFLVKKGIERGDITLVGQVDYASLPSLYGSHDIFVTASLSETFGHPLVEAMASGITIVAADTGVHREVCMNAAEYFDGLTARSLADTVQRVSLDEPLRKEMRARGIAMSENQYDWETHVDRLLDTFAEIHATR